MKPFDNSVQPGDALIDKDGYEYYFVGFTRNGHYIVVEDSGNTIPRLFTEDHLYIPPKKTTYYLNIYRNEEGRISAGEILHTELYSAEHCRNRDLALLKTISFEVDE
jgi:hypothetical protein